MYAKIVDKVGTRTYWEDWAKDVAVIATAQQTRIKALLNESTPDIAAAFDKFVGALRAISTIRSTGIKPWRCFPNT